ncbi:purine/pyrimidine permease [Alkalibacillus salilacus]|uniref:Xanthine/uracil permease n=1 Tax=Alkalibacillus salilacus TaxID=284582 RepID=A0ABT9VGH2_9BACI|nr:purine/pyrimidine permease [Alkalibacillus salilacus]MDQ0160009.1 xanthine/uracil permease [Alkalibacillus salilacus]
MFKVIQWFIFLLANAVAIPIVIGSIFDMDTTAIMQLMQRTFFIVGIAGFLQGLIGHKLPIVDGPAGLWVSTFSVFAISVGTTGQAGVEAFRLLEAAMILTGAFLMAFGLFKVSGKVIGLFTPLVTGVFLTLLTFQLSGTFLEGMLGLSSQATQINSGQFAIAMVTFSSVLILSIFFTGWMKSYAVLLGISLGWLLFVIFFGTGDMLASQAPIMQMPEMFAWGAPKFEWSVVPIAILTAFILLSNIVAALSATSDVIDGHSNFSQTQMNRGSFTLGINHGISGMFSGVAVVPLASTAGFIQLTGQTKKGPFIWASALLMIVSFFPVVIAFLAMIPSPIANAALLATFVQLMGLGLRNLFAEPLYERRMTIITVSMLLGGGLMFIPPESFAHLPETIKQVVSNGLLVGTIIAVVLEKIWKTSE